jgi:hypothetical protein
VGFDSTLPFDALPLSLALLAVFRFVSKSLFLEEQTLCENWMRVGHRMPFNLEKMFGI